MDFSQATQILELPTTILNGLRYAKTFQHAERDLASAMIAFRRCYKLRAKQTHPDKGGSSEAFGHVHAAWKCINETGFLAWLWEGPPKPKEKTKPGMVYGDTKSMSNLTGSILERDFAGTVFDRRKP